MSKNATRSKTDSSLAMPSSSYNSIKIETEYERREKRTLIIFTFIGVALSLTIAILSFQYISANIVGQRKRSISEILGEYKEDTDLNTQYQPIEKIAYVTGNQLYLYDLASKNNQSIYQVNEYNSSLGPLAWRNKQKLTFSICNPNQCDILEYSTTDKKADKLFDIKSSDILSMRWSHNGEKLAYLFRKDDSLLLTIKIKDVFKNLGKFPYESDRTFDTNDAIYLRFSPNDENIMLVNTFTKDKNASVIILDMTGKKILEINRKGKNIPTFAFFTSNTTIYFKKDKYLYVKSLENNKEQKVTDRIVEGFNFTPSPDKTHLTYWTHDWNSGISTIWLYEIGTDSLKRLRDMETFPIFVNDQTLVSLHAKDCRQCSLSKFKFTYFNKFSLKTKVLIELKTNKNPNPQSIAVENHQ